MNDSSTKELKSNVTGNLLTILGAAVAVFIQIVYFNTIGLTNWVDGIVPGILAGVCILVGFKLGKGAYGKTFPVFLVLTAIVAVILGFVLGITYLIYNIGVFTLAEAFLIFFDEYLFADIQGTTLYHSQGIIDFGIAIGIAILIVCGKHMYNHA
ncbi:MAG: hypothetical protein FWB88_10785 [Defluviitaleaceae bacterium]|nr:hypothetical protein [Defluviitaleaceae bacterium]MCL2240075.1 hypothetical protein [Defluviitaleaceae bacterium]MCL2240290.1 hypothetical protein [Defluviitaleaceae bacterium]